MKNLVSKTTMPQLQPELISGSSLLVKLERVGLTCMFGKKLAISVLNREVDIAELHYLTFKDCFLTTISRSL